MFPFSIRGSIPAKPHTSFDISDVRRRICEDLDGQHLAYRTTENEVSFTNKALFVYRLERYSLVERGRFVIEAARISYCLSTKVMVVTASLLTLLPAILMIGRLKYSIADWLSYPAGIWLFLVGANYLLVWFRNRRFLRRVAALPS
jgi:hypothetical protein